MKSESMKALYTCYYKELSYYKNIDYIVGYLTGIGMTNSFYRATIADVSKLVQYSTKGNKK